MEKKSINRRIRYRIAAFGRLIKRHPFRSLSLGMILLGIGCIAFFAYGILSPPSHDKGPYSNLSSLQSPYEAQAGAFQLKEVANKVSNQPQYTRNPSEGEWIGTISIPRLDRVVDIHQGTRPSDLGKGVGHFTQSVLPGIKDNCVLSGHNDTVFTKLDTLRISDLIIVRTIAGEFTYKVSGFRIVGKDDKTVIVPREEAVLTLTTCYPFIKVGPSVERYIVTAQLVDE